MRIKILSLLAVLFLAVPATGHASEHAFDVSVFGKGRPFFMIPGLTATMEEWDDAANRYGVQFQVHRFTLAGFGGVKPVSGPFVERSVAAIKAYAEKNDIHDAIVMGHSVGGIIALKLAAEEPKRFTTVIVVDILPFLGGASFGAKDAAQAAQITDQFKAQMKAMTPQAFQAQQKAQIPSEVAGSANIDMLGRWAETSDISTIIEATCELYASDYRPLLPKVTAPTLVVYGWNPGSNVPAQTVDRLYAAQYAGLPQKTLDRIDNSHHFVMLDQRTAFFRAVDDFLSRPVQLGAAH
jgi:pimeloyl-ACP methyl ester carboxylesterase